ncbi:DNA-binding protein satb1 [Plakobranchus ocellatus]|uniref:DNA-binding protein satb1 n=1 Tax=Plakobranchus ocellatus TaxID=259542 RepID=A0AAV3ZC52_9GAST|nr:DNA-binding protein satb1 [Plakobranchus ocellatus]
MPKRYKVVSNTTNCGLCGEPTLRTTPASCGVFDGKRWPNRCNTGLQETLWNRVRHTSRAAELVHVFLGRNMRWVSSVVLTHSAYSSSVVLIHSTHYSSVVLTHSTHYSSVILTHSAHSSSVVLIHSAHYSSVILIHSAHSSSVVLIHSAHYSSAILTHSTHYSSVALNHSAHSSCVVLKGASFCCVARNRLHEYNEEDGNTNTNAKKLQYEEEDETNIAPARYCRLDLEERRLYGAAAKEEDEIKGHEAKDGEENVEFIK